MSTEEVTKNIWRNSISNYVALGLRMILGLIMFRLLYQYFSKEEFGFWSLLWSLFGYGILIDFGFGMAAMKRVAELSAQEDRTELSRVLSTVFFLYVTVSAVLVLSIVMASGLLVEWFKIAPANKDFFQRILIIFFCGMGLGFPFGIFMEVLIGLQRISLVNVIYCFAFLGNAILVAVGIQRNWGMEVFMIIGLLSGILPNLVCWYYAAKALPGVQVRPRFFSWSIVKTTSTFSIFAYISTVSGILLTKTAQLTLSLTLAVSAIAIYQAGAKVAEMFAAFTQQLPDTFSPAAAHVNAKGHKTYLQQLLINGTRFSVMLATPIYFICAFYMEGMLRLLTGDTVINRETFLIAEVLLLWCYMALITQTVPRRIFMMCGHERRLTWLTLGEAALNLAIGIGLVLYFKNALCIAIGALIATTLFGWFYIWPWAAREANLSGTQLARVVLLPTWLACLPLLAFIVLSRFGPWFDFRGNTTLLFVQCALASAVGAVGLWRLALSAQERAALTLKLSQLFTRFAL